MTISRRRPHVLLSFLLAACVLLAAQSALATTFNFRLHNHPDGSAQPPLYGMRLDELVNVTGNHDIFTFDFDNAGITTPMTLVYDDVASTITIAGEVFGGLVTAGAHTDANWTGFWDVSFLYNVNVSDSIAGMNFALEVTPNSASNNGTIQITSGPNTGTSFNLLDGPMDGGFSFRFNNTDDHRLAGHGLSGPDTFVGWGWLTHGTGAHVAASDWLFTGEKFDPPQIVPEPGSLILLGAGLAGFWSRRRAIRRAR
ncbi:MAG: PEP-CTERM sorting domain-containing protein [Myxococcota bacterium]